MVTIGLAIMYSKRPMMVIPNRYYIKVQHQSAAALTSGTLDCWAIHG